MSRVLILTLFIVGAFCAGGCNAKEEKLSRDTVLKQMALLEPGVQFVEVSEQPDVYAVGYLGRDICLAVNGPGTDPSYRPEFSSVSFHFIDGKGRGIPHDLVSDVKRVTAKNSVSKMLIGLTSRFVRLRDGRVPEKLEIAFRRDKSEKQYTVDLKESYPLAKEGSEDR